MSLEQLRRELQRVGDDAPVVQVPADTWARAQRARRRVRAGVAAGAVAVVLAVTAGGLAWQRGADVDPADSPAPGVPSTLWSVPPASEGGPPTSSDLAPGRAAAAYLTEDGRPAVVGADDGAVRVLALPGTEGLPLGGPAIALSPDGHRLAFAWGEPDVRTAHGRSGIRLLDLATGDVESVVLRAGAGILVQDLLWSPDSRSLLWRGIQASRWTTERYGGDRPAAGVVSPTAGRARFPTPTDEDPVATAIADDGSAAIAGLEQLVTLRDGEGAQQPRRGWFPNVVTPAGEVQLECIERERADGWESRCRQPATAERAAPTAVDQLDQRYLFVIGRLADGTTVASSADRDAYEGPRRLTLVDLDGPGPVVRDVGTVEAGTAVTLALDLMTNASPTVDRPAPSWVSDDHGSPLGVRWIAGGIAVLLALAAGAALVVRRRRTPVVE